MNNGLVVRRADITTLPVDAIVNAAAPHLLGGGGVDGAIHRVAGPELRKACHAIPEVVRGIRCPTGGVRITPGFGLPARFVVHTVGPVWQGGGSGERALLGSCYAKSMRIAALYDAETIAFPAISTGTYGFPAQEAAPGAVRTVATELPRVATIRQATLVAFTHEDAATLQGALDAFLRDLGDAGTTNGRRQ